MRPPAASEREIKEAAATDSPHALSLDEEPLSLRSRGPQTGDFVVYRFSGSFREHPLILTQQVVAQPAPGSVTIDVTFDDGQEKKRLRLRFKETGEGRELLSAAQLLPGGAQAPFGIEAYEELMASTMPEVESNDAVIGTSTTDVHVGEEVIPALKRSFLISFNGAPATMDTYESESFSWGDVGGRITDPDGEVMYRAEVIEAGNRGLGRTKGIAVTDHQLYADDYD